MEMRQIKLDWVYCLKWDRLSQKIVFFDFKPYKIQRGKTAPTKDIRLFDLSTHTSKPVFSETTEVITHILNLVFLLENNSILFSGRKEIFNTLYRYDINSQKLQIITLTGNSFDIVNFVLSPDGKLLLVSIPSYENPIQNYISTIYSIEGQLLAQLTLIKNAQVYSWVSFCCNR